MADLPEAFLNSLPSWPPELARLVPLFVRETRTPPPVVFQPDRGPPELSQRQSDYPVLSAAVLVNEAEAVILQRFIDDVFGRNSFRFPDRDSGAAMIVAIEGQQCNPNPTFDPSANGYRAELCLKISHEGVSLRQ